MRNSRFKIQVRYLFCLLHFAVCLLTANAQSTSQDFPTPVTTNEISGKIIPRDIGDARLTSYFYIFNGTQGDVFINVEAMNLNGDIDVFTAGNLRPLTKISLYAGDTTVETGRVIYLRKPEKLILRVEGRSPNDNPATFRIKFAGSFAALPPREEAEEPKLPEVKPDDKSGIRVNSVGTIIEVKPKPTPQPKETIAETEKKEEKPAVEEQKTEEKTPENATEKEETKSTEVVITEEIPKTEAETVVTENENKAKPPPRRGNRRTDSKKSRSNAPQKTENADVAENKTEAPTIEAPPKTISPKSRRNRRDQPPKEPVPDPLAVVNLIVLLKDGTKIERPMSEVLRVSVDRGTLTIITKDGKIERRSILDVVKMTIEQPPAQ